MFLLRALQRTLLVVVLCVHRSNPKDGFILKMQQEYNFFNVSSNNTFGAGFDRTVALLIQLEVRFMS